MSRKKVDPCVAIPDQVMTSGWGQVFIKLLKIFGNLDVDDVISDFFSFRFLCFNEQTPAFWIDFLGLFILSDGYDFWNPHITYPKEDPSRHHHIRHTWRTQTHRLQSVWTASQDNDRWWKTDLISCCQLQVMVTHPMGILQRNIVHIITGVSVIFASDFMAW